MKKWFTHSALIGGAVAVVLMPLFFGLAAPQKIHAQILPGLGEAVIDTGAAAAAENAATAASAANASSVAAAGTAGTPLIVDDVPAKIYRIVSSIGEILAKAAKTAAAVAYKNGLQYFFHKLAYDTAVWIATGDNDQESLLYQDNWSDFVPNLADEVAGEFLNTIATENGFLELNLCEPLPSAKTQLLLGFNLSVDAPSQQPTCSLREIIDNFDQALAEEDFNDRFAVTFLPAENDLGSFVILQNELIAQQSADSTAAILERLTNQGFKDLTDKVSGAVTTPGNLIAQKLFDLDSQSTTPETQYTGELVADTINIFTSTLVSKLLTRAQEGLFPVPYTALEDSLEGNARTGGATSEAAERFASLRRPTFKTGGTRDILNELTSCPTGGGQIPNCTMTESFRIAAEQGLTLRQAVEDGFINGDQPFAWEPTTTDEKISLTNPVDGIGYRAILVLKHYRVVPAGWQVAAEYIRDFSEENKTLNQLMAEFDMCGQTGGEYSPFCGLVDPDWVLKAPQNFCDLQGFSNNIAETIYTDLDGSTFTPSVEKVVRVEECVDDRSCIKESDDGTCEAYGYCYKEKEVYRFDGESCAEYYQSCETLTRSDGARVNYTMNTVNSGSCDASAVGCNWYCTEENSSGGFDCTGPGDDVTGDGNADTVTLTRDAEECNEFDAGCTEYFRAAGSGANLLSNGSFEYFEGTPDDGAADLVGFCSDNGAACANNGGCAGECLGWQPEVGTIEITGSEQQAGGVSAKFVENGVPLGVKLRANSYIDTKEPLENRTFTLRLNAKNNGDACTFKIALPNAADGVCSDNSTPDNDRSCEIDLGANSGWDEFVLTATYPNGTSGEIVRAVIQSSDSDCDQLIIDAVSLTEGFDEDGEIFGYSDYSAAPDTVYLTERAETCSTDDVGCKAFTDVETSEMVPGQITNPSAGVCENNFTDPSCSQCFEETVGCDAFEEVVLENQPPDPTHVSRSGYYCYGDQAVACTPDSAGAGQGQECIDADLVDPSCLNTLSLIPDTGTECAYEDVGCEQYTNLDEVAAGGEGVEYYSQLRQCVQPDEPDVVTFYTWQGTESAGYELVAYNLKRSQVSNYSYTEADGTLVEEQGAGPCTNLDFDDDEPEFACLDEDQGPIATCDAEDFGVNPDCYQFYDEAGRTFYRLNSRTIAETEDCQPLRNSLDNNVYWAATGESTSCNAVVVGCREYRGAAGNNVRKIVNDTFEDNQSAWSEGFISWESTQIDGHSLYINAGIPESDRSVAGEVEQDGLYVLTFWATTTGSNISTSWAFTGDPTSNGDEIEFPANGTNEVDLEAGVWKQYRLGPVTFDRIPHANEQLRVTINGNANVLLDNIQLTTSGSKYLLHDSYDTCQFYEGCREYEDEQNQTHYLKSWTRLCDEEVAGCAFFIDTQNSNNPFRTNYLNDNTIAEDDISVPADEYVALVYSEDAECSSPNEKGCMVLGQPNMSQATNTVSEFETVYRINDPDSYDDILCRANQIMCEEYTTESGIQYFKDPGDRVCEYRASGDGTTYGWFIVGSGSDRPDCPTEFQYTVNDTSSADQPLKAICDGGVREGYTCNSDADCPGSICGYKFTDNNGDGYADDGWVGLCSEEADGCGLFLDPFTADLNENASFETDATGNLRKGIDGLLPAMAFIPDEPDGAADGWVHLNLTWLDQVSLADLGYPEVTLPAGFTFFDGNDDLNESAFALDRFNEAGIEQIGCDSVNLYSTEQTRTGDHSMKLTISEGNTDVLCPVINQDLVEIDRTKTYNFGGWVYVESGNADITFGLAGVNADGQWLDWFGGDPFGYVAKNELIGDGLDSQNGEWVLFQGTFGPREFTQMPSDPDDPTGNMVSVRPVVLFQHADTGNNGNVVAYIDDFYLRENEEYTYLRQSIDGVDGGEGNSCNGVIDADNGCVAFRDVTEDTQTYYSASQAVSELEDVKIELNELDADERFVNQSCEINDFDDPDQRCRMNPSTSDTNAVIKVRQDRECAEWLACEQSRVAESTDGELENVCFRLGTCSSLSADGICDEWTLLQDEDDLTVDTDLTFTSSWSNPLDVEEFKNYSGYSKVGVFWGPEGKCQGGYDSAGVSLDGSDCLNDDYCLDATGQGRDGVCIVNVSTEGNYPYSYANEVGDTGAMTSDEIVPNWDLEDTRCTTDGPSKMVGQPCTKAEHCQTATCNENANDGTSRTGSCVPQDSWCNNIGLFDESGNLTEVNELRTGSNAKFAPWTEAGNINYYHSSAADVGIINFDEDLNTTADAEIDTNNVLLVEPKDQKRSGVSIDLGEQIQQGGEYVLSFDARYVKGLTDHLDPVIFAFEHASDSTQRDYFTSGYCKNEIVTKEGNVVVSEEVEITDEVCYEDSECWLLAGSDTVTEGNILKSCTPVTATTNSFGITTYEYGDPLGFCTTNNDCSQFGTTYRTSGGGSVTTYQECRSEDKTKTTTSSCDFSGAGLEFTTQMETYTLGPITITEKDQDISQFCVNDNGVKEDPLRECASNADCTTGSYDTCKTFLPTTSLLAFQENGSENNAFILDNISLRPALEVSKEAGVDLVHRECRLYPESDSPSCDYYDENLVHYKGLRGYCLEHDPINPNLCISWYPIEALSGELDAFEKEKAGYDDRAPLYQCLVAKGMADYGVCGDWNNDTVAGLYRFEFTEYLLTDGFAELCRTDADCSGGKQCFRGEQTNMNNTNWTVKNKDYPKGTLVTTSLGSGGNLDLARNYFITTREIRQLGFGVAGDNINTGDGNAEGFVAVMGANPAERNININELDRLMFDFGGVMCGEDNPDDKCDDPDEALSSTNDNYMWMPPQFVDKDVDDLNGFDFLNDLNPVVTTDPSVDSANCASAPNTGSNAEDPRYCWWADKLEYDNGGFALVYMYTFWDQANQNKVLPAIKRILNIGKEEKDPFGYYIEVPGEYRQQLLLEELDSAAARDVPNDKICDDICIGNTDTGGDDGNNVYAVKLTFYPSGYLDYISIAAYPGQKQDRNQYAWDSRKEFFTGQYPEMRYYLRDSCVVVGEVVDEDGNNRAWSERVSDGSSYTTPTLKYQYDTDVSPFGAIASWSGLLDPTTFDSRASYSLGDQGYEPPYVEQDSGSNFRAGSPYACVGECSMQVCQTADGNLTDIQCGGCPGDSECVGVGVCRWGENDSEYCRSDDDCPDGTCYGLVGEVNGTRIRPFASNIGVLIDKPTYLEQVGGALAEAAREVRNVFADIIGNGLWVYNNLEQEYCAGDCTNNALVDFVYPGYLSLFKNPFKGIDQLNFYNTGKILSGMDPCEVVPGTCVIPTGDVRGQCDNAGEKEDKPCTSNDDCYGYNRDNDEYCGVVPSVKHIKVNGQETGDVILKSGDTLTLTFEASVNQDQLPLSLIQINWNNDFSWDIEDYWNGLPLQEHRYTKVVDCDNPLGCVLKPRITIHDNWGFCSGATIDQINNIRGGAANPDIRDATGDGDSCGFVFDAYDGNVIVMP